MHFLRMFNAFTLITLCCFAFSVYSFKSSPAARFTISRGEKLNRSLSPLRADILSNSFHDAALFDAIKVPVENYVSIWIPLFKDAAEKGLVPDFLLRWGHGGAMSTVLFIMGGIGAFLGWQIRLNNGNSVYPFTLGKTAREQHGLIMGLASFFFLLGGQGGLVLLSVQGKPILESAHAVTAIAGLSLLLVQALLPFAFEKGGKTARSVHAYLGSATMVLLLVHFVNGLNLGLSI